MNSIKKPILKSVDPAVSKEVDHLVLEIDDYLSDLQDHRISKKNLAKVSWKSFSDDNIPAVQRLYNLVSDYLKLESLIDSTTLLKDPQIVRTRQRVYDLLVSLDLWKDLKEKGLKFLKQMAFNAEN